MQKPPGESLGSVVGKRIRQIRERQGVSVPALVARCKELGYHVDKNTLYRLEVGHRDDPPMGLVYAVGLALETSPLVLAQPAKVGHPMRVTPGYVAHAEAVYEWIVGGGLVPTRAGTIARPPKDERDEPMAEQVRLDRLRRLEAQAALLRDIPYALNHHQGERLDAAALHGEGLIRLLTDAAVDPASRED